ncbi:carbohydrate binding family 9 domain-containing protein [Aquimarina sp. U1-2]|uniref:DUF5916 domain-containing protein n=1 Tax=Aquimarina sp. U1-2 TaxID=2823141 RepID=UPI001AEC9E4B|nr:DUF5916 domain-containing protein [Aquimarina sp. U1-2]MBP2834172.1 carbohydrate binding family 9 domain-containing protein [Aquimarina sp. U1-2]
MKHLFCICSILISGLCSAQISNINKSITIGYANETITLDGKLDEAIWSKLTPIENFRQNFPSDSVPARAPTQIYMFANDQHLHIGVVCHSSGNNWIVNSLRRDYQAGGADNITLLFDTFSDGTNAFFFGINPEGVLREGTISNGGDFSLSWENKWKGRSHVYDNYYTAELVIPFSTLRYNIPSEKWKFYAYRFDSQTNEISTWPGTPINQNITNMAYSGDMIWEKTLDTKSGSVSLIPFVTSGINKNYEDDTATNTIYEIGGDAKIAITPGLNLDLTVNPDFSQVEVDAQITNLDRFEIFFPERRQFFLENADLFGEFGFGNINPFFSRRIGVGTDTQTDATIQNRIYGGVRLSGKIDPKTRIGVLNMQTASEKSRGVPGTNYGVGVIQRKLWSRSNVGIIAVNKQIVEDVTPDSVSINAYNRVLGADFNYASYDNTYSGKTFVHTSFTPDNDAQLAHGTFFEYNTRKLGMFWSHEYVDDNYNAEVGFVRRKDYFRISPGAELRYYPQNKWINDYAISAEMDMFWRPELGKTDHTYSLGIGGQFTERAQFNFSVNHEYIFLFNAFDPTGTESDELAAGQDFSYVNVTGRFRSDTRKVFSWEVNPYLGQYFNGWRYGTDGSFTIRYQPYGSFTLNYAVNTFNMPHLDGSRQTFLISPRIDYTLSKSLFTSFFIQYNSQTDNTNINARIQWRFAPVSDLIIVYTDNYLTGNIDTIDRFALDIRNRSIVLKLTYWLNI